MKNTIAQQLNIKEFPFEIKDSDGNKIYWEGSTSGWWKCEFDSNNLIYFEDSDGYWCKKEYDVDGRVISYESSNGVIVDNQPASVELTLDEVADKFGIDVKNLKIKK